MPAFEIVEHAAGVTWVRVDEVMQRASHAVGDERGVWLVDPLDDADALRRAQALGPVRGVLQLFEHHARDGESLAKRLGVPHDRLPSVLPDAPLQVISAVSVPGRREKALWWPQRRTLVVAESLGTGPYFRLGPGRLGMHPFARPLPPRTLRGTAADVLLVGHGRPLLDGDAPAAIEEAYRRARRDVLYAPRRILQGLRSR